MTSGSFDRSSADGKTKKEKASVKKMADVKKDVKKSPKYSTLVIHTFYSGISLISYSKYL